MHLLDHKNSTLFPFCNAEMAKLPFFDPILAKTRI
jgi:hypothetical protein